jgi:hypothetical protein
MSLLPLSVQFNRSTNKSDNLEVVYGSLAFVNFIRNNLEIRNKIKHWNKLDTNQLVASALIVLQKQKLKRLRTWLYDKLHPAQKRSVLVDTLLSSECDYEVKVIKRGIQYMKNGVVVKEIQFGEPGTETEFEDLSRKID